MFNATREERRPYHNDFVKMMVNLVPMLADAIHGRYGPDFSLAGCVHDALKHGQGAVRHPYRCGSPRWATTLSRLRSLALIFSSRHRQSISDAPILFECKTQALRARTAGRSAGAGKRRALAGSVATVTVFPVMSKNSTE